MEFHLDFYLRQQRFAQFRFGLQVCWEVRGEKLSRGN